MKKKKKDVGWLLNTPRTFYLKKEKKKKKKKERARKGKKNEGGKKGYISKWAAN